MKSIKIILLVVMLLAGTYIAHARGVEIPVVSPFLDQHLDQQKVATLTKSLPEVPQLPQNVTDQTKVLGERTAEVTSHVQNVLGAYVQNNASDEAGTGGTSNNISAEQPIHEAAFEYGRYMYCQQVVKDYESRQEAK